MQQTTEQNGTDANMIAAQEVLRTLTESAEETTNDESKGASPLVIDGNALRGLLFAVLIAGLCWGVLLFAVKVVLR